MQQNCNDPNYVVEFAVGDPFPSLVPQKQSTGIHFSGVYYDETKRYVLKKAHMSLDDHRIFDVDTGLVVYVSHHLGKNPYESLDPLGLANTDQIFNVNGGEWESKCNVSGQEPFHSFKVRPKKLTRHGRQYVRTLDDDSVLMNVGKMSKLKTRSVRPHFMVGRGSDAKDVVYKCKADMLGRTIAITNAKDELVAQIAKTTKAMIKTAVFGSGSESTIDIAPGVDCSTILAVVLAIGQIGKHFVRDAFNSFVAEPIKDNAVESAVSGVMGADDPVADDDGNIGSTALGGITEAADVGGADVGEIADVGEMGTAVAENVEGVGSFFASFFQ